MVVDKRGALKTTSRKSLYGLDSLNFFMADVIGGVGPFLAIFLSSQRGWNAGAIGAAVATASIAAVIVQTPAGAFVDQTNRKRAVVATCALSISCALFAITIAPSFFAIIIAQCVIGAAGTFFPPSIAAISMGLVGLNSFPRRAGRNEAFNHGGNVVAALISAFVSSTWGVGGVFVFMALFGLAGVTSVLLIKPEEIDNSLARSGEADTTSGGANQRSFGEILARKEIILFITSVVLFHFANAAMLPLVGQKVAQYKVMEPGSCMAACIFVAQLVMIPTAIAASKYCESVGRKSVFLVGFLSLPLRGILFATQSNPYVLIAAQILDGIGAGVYGVLGVVTAADLTKGTGRFNFTQGVVATALGLGSALSNVVTGLIVSKFGYTAGFIFLTAVAVIAVAFYFWLVPETAELLSKSAPNSVH